VRTCARDCCAKTWLALAGLGIEAAAPLRARARDAGQAYPGPDLRIFAAIVADISRDKSQKVKKIAKGRNTKSCKSIFTIISVHFDKVAQRRKAKSRKVAKGRTKSRNVACNYGDLQV
jgi:hypothetical protein